MNNEKKEFFTNDVEVDVADHHLEGLILLHLGARNVLLDDLKQTLQIVFQVIGLQACDTIPSRRVNHGNVELIVVGAQIDEKIVNLIQHPLGTGGGLIDLIDHDDGN